MVVKNEQACQVARPAPPDAKGIRARLLARFGEAPKLAEEVDRFISQYETHRRAVELFPLSVLVWGPGQKATNRVAEKRRQIRQKLLESGFVAYFSEDLTDSDYSTSLLSQELAQALSVHLVIILVEDALGALGEAEDFGNHPDIAWRVFVLAPQEYKNGYSGKGTFLLLERGYGAMYWYSKDDFTRCNVLQAALIRASARREIYSFYRFQRGMKP